MTSLVHLRHFNAVRDELIALLCYKNNRARGRDNAKKHLKRCPGCKLQERDLTSQKRILRNLQVSKCPLDLSQVFGGDDDVITCRPSIVDSSNSTSSLKLMTTLLNGVVVVNVLKQSGSISHRVSALIPGVASHNRHICKNALPDF